jgi:protocatechuate 3,4-dioxygenase beta subunit
MTSTAFAELCHHLATPRQTRGPFFPYDDAVSLPIREREDPDLPIFEANDHDLTKVKGRNGVAHGQIIHFQGQILAMQKAGKKETATCAPWKDVTILLWQANSSGLYNHKQDNSAPAEFLHPQTGQKVLRVHDENFQYWGRAVTDAEGRFTFKTIVPGFYPAAEDWYRPPHLHFSIRAKGYPEFVTQTYFKGNDLPNNDFFQELNSRDWVLRNPRTPPAQQEQLIINYQKDPIGNLNGELIGACQFVINA